MPLPSEIKIQPVTGPLHARVQPPGSKSITNRALVCAALAEGTSTLRGALDSEDTQVMIASLKKLGIDSRIAERRAKRSSSRAAAARSLCARPNYSSPTAARRCVFSRPWSRSAKGAIASPASSGCISGRLPICSTALATTGRDCQSENANGCPPVVVAGLGLLGGQAEIAGSISSQFLSALMMACPGAHVAGGTGRHGRTRLAAICRNDRRRHAFVRRRNRTWRSGRFRIPAPQVYQARDYWIEPDASAASYFFAAAAITGGEITVKGFRGKPAGRCRVLRLSGSDGLRRASTTTNRSPSVDPAGQAARHRR